MHLILRSSKRAFQLGLTFIIFGILDNGIMIVAGDAIDSHLAAGLGLSTMFAAGLGNTISDAFGIFAGRWIDHRFEKFMPKRGETSKGMILFAETSGIIIGCLIGMLPLLFL